jgi:anti-sigma factor RsiW
METAEEFVMKRMGPREATVYEEHLARCQACSEIVAMTRAFVQGMRDASRKLADDDEKPN